MNDKRRWGVWLLALCLLPLLLQQVGNGWVRIADTALLYVLLAVGLNIVVGYAGLLDLGYVAFFAVGAYLYALLASPHLIETFEWMAVALPGGLHTPLWLVIPAAAALAGLAGVLLGAPTLKLRGDYLAIVTLGFGEIIGGGQRLEDYDLLLKRIEEHKLPKEAFEWYLDLRRFGSVPHGGFGMGIERVVSWVCGLDHLREAIPYPRMLYRLTP